MKIIKTKTIEAIDVSEIPDTLIDFKNREKLHDSEIPEFFAYIQDYAWYAFISHGIRVYQEVKHEAQGIFIGQYYKDKFGKFIVATTYEEGDGLSQMAFVEMSEKCLANISEKCQNEGSLMLIWVHTHPDFGAFYSGTDYNCLKTNFYKPYQIGIVVDILRNQYKGFKIKGNNVVDFFNYALFNDEQNTLFSPYKNEFESHKTAIETNKIELNIKLSEEANDINRNLGNRIIEVENREEKQQPYEETIGKSRSDLQTEIREINQSQETSQDKILEYEKIKIELKDKEKKIDCLATDLETLRALINQVQESLENLTHEINQLQERLITV